MRTFKSVALGLALLTAAMCRGSVLTFDDIGEFVGLGDATYGGVFFGTSSMDSLNGATGYFLTLNAYYASPHSLNNVAINALGVDDLWFDFGAPTTFNGAYFSLAQGASPENRAAKVRFVDNLGDTTPWLTLQSQTQFLKADFSGATRVYVERNGGPGLAQWYAMDDLTFNGRSPTPEPSSVAALTIGAAVMWRRSKSLSRRRTKQ